MSVLLPKTLEEFSSTDYWDAFFKARGSKSFEWYGEYHELSEYLHKYVKSKDCILITGCGNSTIGENLYDLGYRDITNIDVSPVVIKQMTLRSKERPNLKYFVMDALNTTFDNEKFSVIIDKGTLDALMPNNQQETVDRIEKYFKEIDRIMKISGRYICISLLQSHILKVLLDYFPKNNWMFRVVRCFEAERKAAENGEKAVPVFIVICTKFKVLPNMLLEADLNGLNKYQRFNNIDDILLLVSSSQQAEFICSNLQKSTNISEEISIELKDPISKNVKYSIYVLETKFDKKKPPYAAFIVPQGREAEWLFSTKAGRKQLAEMSKHVRIAIITMHRNQQYGSLEEVQKELWGVVGNLAPINVKNDKNYKIPFLSLDSGIGNRNILYEGLSKLSGNYVVEDVEIDGTKFRRLFFTANQLVIQSEAKLKQQKNKKGKLKDVVDLLYLTCKHHVYMSVGAYVACKNKTDASIVVVGVGGGGLCAFLNKFLPQANILGLDIDEEILKVAKEWFGFKENKKLNVQVCDGLKFLNKSLSNGTRYDAILFDVDSKDLSVGMSCPPKEFLEDKILNNVQAILSPNGIFVLNLVLRDKTLWAAIADKLKKRFVAVTSFLLDEDLNEIFICAVSEFDHASLKKTLERAVSMFNKFIKNQNGNQNFNIEENEFNEKLKIIN